MRASVHRGRDARTDCCSSGEKTAATMQDKIAKSRDEPKHERERAWLNEYQ